MADKSPRHATIKKPSKTIKQKRAAKKLKLEQVTRRDVIAASTTGEPNQTAAHNLDQVGTEPVETLRLNKIYEPRLHSACDRQHVVTSYCGDVEKHIAIAGRVCANDSRGTSCCVLSPAGRRCPPLRGPGICSAPRRRIPGAVRRGDLTLPSVARPPGSPPPTRGCANSPGVHPVLA